MKRIYSYIIFTSCLIALSSCEDYIYGSRVVSKEPCSFALREGGSTMYGDPNISCEVEGGTYNFYIDALNVQWTASKSADWVEVTPSAGSSNTALSVKVAPNPSFSASRTAIVTLMAQAGTIIVTRQINISQRNGTPVVSVDNSALSFSGKEETKTVNVTSNIDWTPVTNKQWIHPERDGSKLKVSVDGNPQGYRSGSVYIEADVDSNTKSMATISVYQEAGSLSADVSSIIFLPDGGSKDVQLQTDYSWTSEIDETGKGYYSLTPATGDAGTHTLSVDGKPNKSTADISSYIFIKSAFDSTIKHTISVKQAHQTGTLTSNISVLDYEGGEISLKLNANCDWELKKPEDASWLTFDVNSGAAGTDERSVLLTVESYSESVDREATIQLVAKNGGKVLDEKTIRQTAFNVVTIVGNTTLTDSKLHTVSVDLESNTTWTAEPKVDWISVEPSSGEGDAHLIATVEDNPNVDSRQGDVLFTAGYDEKLISFKQPGRHLSVNTSSLHIINAGGTSEAIVIDTDGEWGAITSTTWLKVNKVNDNTFTVTAEPNSGIEEREGSVLCRLTDLQSGSLERSITVTQDGVVIEPSENALEFDFEGDENVVQLTTNCAWEAVASDSWIALSRTSGESGTNQLTVTVGANEQGTKREGVIEFYSMPSHMKIESATISVSQDKLRLNVTHDDLTLPDSKPKEIICNVDCNSTWTTSVAESAQSWLTVSASKGKSDGTVVVRIADNNTTESRTGEVTFSSEPLSQTILIEQPGRYLRISNTSASFSYKGGEYPVTIETDGEYEINASESWITIKKDSSSFAIVAAENDSEDKRTATVTVTMTGLAKGYSLSHVVNVTQRGNKDNNDLDINIDDYDADTDANPGGDKSSNIGINKGEFEEDEDWN